jgi:hypothetical protein
VNGMAEFVNQHVADKFGRQKEQFGVERHILAGRTTGPARALAFHEQSMKLKPMLVRQVARERKQRLADTLTQPFLQLDNDRFALQTSAGDRQLTIRTSKPQPRFRIVLTIDNRSNAEGMIGTIAACGVSTCA